jgi:hypothetical protein
MAYTAKTVKQLRQKSGSLLQKIATELGLVDTELAALEAEIDRNESKFIDLTINLGTDTAKATSGIDLASGSDITKYGFFFPVDVTLIKMHDYLNEAYVKDTSDAKIEVYDEDAAKLFGRTLTAGGEAVKTHTQTDPEAAAVDVDAGTAFYLKASHTDVGSGTGHASVIVEYKER